LKAAAGRHPSSCSAPVRRDGLRQRLDEAEETLRAIRNGEVDAVLVAGTQGDRVFTLQGAEHAYRVLIESMNEGALALTAERTILYANQCFARMVKCPLEKVTGSLFHRFLSIDDRATLGQVLKQPKKAGTKIQVLLCADDGSRMAAQISIRPLAGNGSDPGAIGMVVTDITEARRAEERLRALTRRVVQVQEVERGRVAVELHDNITQLLCAVIFRSHALARKLSACDRLTKLEAIKLNKMLVKTVKEVERITHDLGPSMLDHLGLAAVLRDARREFVDRTGVAIKLTCTQVTGRLPAAAELALYRIFQESLRNVEKHAEARHVIVRLWQKGAFVFLSINDDGIGFDQVGHLERRNRKGGLGLLSMSERASYVGGTLEIKSIVCAGTKIEVRIPFV
jgi:two-component system NarL family sensor kinase